jgi:hypothetical protein
MSRYKEETLELYGVRKALSPYGYYVCNIIKRLGGGDVSINAVSCLPGEHDEDMRRDEELLLSLPDDISARDHGEARHKAYKARQEALESYQAE